MKATPISNQLNNIADKLRELGQLYYDLSVCAMTEQSDPNLVHDAVKRGREFYSRERMLRQFQKL